VSVPDFRAYQKRVTRSVVDALASSKCRKVAILSSMGAEHAAGTGPIVGLHELEQGLRGLAIDVLAIRAGFFMENMLTNIGLIRGQGVLGAPAPAEAPMTLIASHDIGRYAGERLAALDWNGFEVVNLMGPALVTFGQATQIIGQAIGKPDLPYVKFSFDDTKQGMVQAGLPEQLADLYIEMYQGAGKNLLAPQAGTPIVHTETTFESFAQQVFAPAYRAAGAA
jgi:uncharacterized protein YbjT (DUF2867 family)